MTPHQESLFREITEFESEINWTMTHIQVSFTLPTVYNAPGQEDVEFEESKVKIPLDVHKIELIPSYSLDQLEDVVRNWMYYLGQLMKDLKERVSCFVILCGRVINVFSSNWMSLRLWRSIASGVKEKASCTVLSIR